MNKNKQPYYVLNYYYLWGFQDIEPLIEYSKAYDRLFGGKNETR